MLQTTGTKLKMSIVTMKKPRRKQSRNALRPLQCYLQQLKSTTIGSVTSRIATGVRTVLPDER
jgi:hypothetical protein